MTCASWVSARKAARRILPVLVAAILTGCSMDGMRSLSSDAAHGVGGDLQTGDWPTYGGDAGAMKYSPVTDIDRGNVANLVEAWSWDTGAAPISGPRWRPPPARPFLDYRTL